MATATANPEAYLRELLPLAQQNLRTNEDLLPVVFVETDTGIEVLGLASMPDTHRARMVMFYVLGRRYAQRDVLQVTAINDVYYLEKALSPTGERPILDHSLADDPEAKEAISITLLTATGTVCSLMCPYEREVTLDGATYTFAEPHIATEVEASLLESFFFGVRS